LETRVKQRQSQNRQHAGDNEQDAGRQSSPGAVEQPTDVGGQLLGLGVREGGGSS
jgi:hypothetical protein